MVTNREENLALDRITARGHAARDTTAGAESWPTLAGRLARKPGRSSGRISHWLSARANGEQSHGQGEVGVLDLTDFSELR